MLLGVDQVTRFPHAVKDLTGELLQVDQARIMQSEITGKYIILGSGKRHSKHTEGRSPGIENNQSLELKKGNKLEG